jgi:hypothetical protein
MKKKRTRNIKAKNHDNIVDNYDKQKSKHLDKLAKRMLDNDEKFSRLRDKNIEGKFLDLF